MWYECQWDNSPSKYQFIKVNNYRSIYGLQHEDLAHTEQQAIKGPKIISVKTFKRENQRSYLYKKTRNEKHDLGQVQIFAAGFNVLMVPNLLPFYWDNSITSQHRKTHDKISIGRLNSIKKRTLIHYKRMNLICDIWMQMHS